MITFWDNVVQLARFFISSVTGLIFIILSPLVAIKKQPIFGSLLLVFGILVIVLIYQILQAMLGINTITDIV